MHSVSFIFPHAKIFRMPQSEGYICNQGRAIFGSGSSFDLVKYNNEKLFVPAQV
jgi:hypothetical protein